MFTRNQTVIAHLTSLAAVLSLLGSGIAALHLASPSAHAQTPAPPVPAQSVKEAADIQLALDDIDTLHILLPLKLTLEQMDKLAAAITSAKTAYEKKSAALSTAPLLKMADEIRDIRKKAIAGAPIPTTFDDRIKGIQADYNAKRLELDTANIVAVSGACKPILTPDQIALCTKMEIDAYKRNKHYNDKASDTQYFNAYVVDVFIGNPRLVPLLKEMRAAQPAK